VIEYNRLSRISKMEDEEKKGDGKKDGSMVSKESSNQM
jgi:hypothetical protein